MLRPQFAYKQYHDLEIFREHVENLVDCIACAGNVVDLQPLFFRFTLDTTTAFLFGESVYSLSASGRETKFEEAFNTAQAFVAKRFRLLDLYWLLNSKKFQEACALIHRYADEILDRSLEARDDKQERNSRYIFLDAVIREIPEREALRHQMMNILVAGRDTTACLLSWTL